MAIAGIVVLPLVLRFVGLAATTEWLIAILRWPVLLATIVVSLACIYRYGPSRKDARWRWVTWGRGSNRRQSFLVLRSTGLPAAETAAPAERKTNRQRANEVSSAPAAARSRRENAGPI